MKLTTAAVSALVLVLAGCSGNAADTGAGSAPVVDGATFTLGLSSDPGALDPQMGAGTSLFTVTQFAYDPLVSVDGKSGEIQSALAKSWQVQDKTVTLTLNDGITCADGAKLTASAVADNLNFVANPKNASPFLGVFYPNGAKAAGDDASGKVTITLAEPAPFVLNGLGNLPIVCPSGLADRKTLQKATSGTGPYKLVEAAPGDHYTYEVRDGYTWGPNGATTATKGTPKTVVVKVVQNETTAANLLISGGLSAAEIIGPDAQRLKKAGLFSAGIPALVGEQWYNHAAGRVTSDPKVRMALTQALDLAQLRKVVTSGQGTAATTLAANAPVACPGDSVKSALPATDPAAAAKLLDEAGWVKGAGGVRAKGGKPLKVTLLYQNNLGSGGDAGAELAVRQWKAIGVDAVAHAQSETTLTSTIFGAGDWDVSWVSLNVSSPDQLVPFLSGPAAPKGTNFAAIQDADYDKAVTAAKALPGTEGCKAWLDAESGLIAKASIVPFASKNVLMFGKAARFDIPGQLAPTSIRMLAK
ncbi:ABC transporter substrate-binding protein [Cryptosporangium phraense]|uniref:ABC transporter substrate-binding protein n=1 Tax=Cryptosporangium phraense TaxID=2593070 RepID=A0A545AZT9_9ACTN|nr:ABC transporter substrate-binding protein [Cryptosporangium phraense]TQS46837.1 ABC transporter substrate-binding protein [Cryptosporangium phraense]